MVCQGQKKLVVCSKHIEECLAKKLDIYPLDGLRFITCPADVLSLLYPSVPPLVRYEWEKKGKSRERSQD